MAMASTSRRGWRGWRRQAAFCVSGHRSATISATGSLTPFEDMGEQSVKNIARAGAGSMRCALKGLAGLADGKRCRPPLQIRRPSQRHASRSSSCRSRNLKRRPGTAVFRGRHHRGPHDRSLQARRIWFVISRNTAFTYRNKVVDTKQNW